MKKSTIISLILIIAAFLIGYGLGQQKQTPIGEKEEVKEPIKIGAILPLTGKAAFAGESARQGIELALKNIESKIEIVYEDVPIEQIKKAPAAFNKLSDIEKVSAIIGPLGSGVAMSIVPLVDEKQIPIVLNSVSALDATKNNKYVFRLWTTAENYAETILPEIQKQGYQKVAALTAIKDNVLDLFQILDKEINFIADERVTTDNVDFRTQLTKIKKQNPDALFLNLYVGQIGLAAKQTKELGFDIPLFSNSVMTTKELELGAEALEGIWYPRFAGYNDKVRQEFISTYGKEPANPEAAASAYDALLILAQAIKQVGSDGEKIKNYLYINTFNGSIGEFRFKENGDAIVPLKIKTVKNGEIVDLKN